MKRKFSTLFLCLLIANVLQAQIWNGSAGTNWNTAANWTPATVPIATSDVTIPNTVNKPKLANNVTINGFSMNANSGLDFNGFTLTSNGLFDVNGGTLNNSSAITDIVITITGTSILYFRQNIVNDNITINHNSSAIFYEAYQFPNTFNGNCTVNCNGTGELYTSYDNASTYNGNLTINRTVAGVSTILNVGAAAITGNFSYTNNAGGNTSINQSATIKVPVTGTINITAAGGGNPEFLMKRVQNNTTGGTISVQNSGYVYIANDTLLVNTLNVNGYTGGNTDDFLQNKITGTVNISDNAANTGFIYFRGNTVNGNTTITVNSASALYEAYQFPNTFNGNTSFNIAGAASVYTSYDNASTYNGNLTINRTVAGFSDILSVGATAVTGNFSYTNNTGGNTSINQSATIKVPINGTINITATGAGNPDFLMKRLQNSTSGGTVSIQNSGFVTIAYDTLLVSALNVNGYTGGNTDDFLQNQITGTVNISDAATNTGSNYFRGNTINGNTIITNNSTAILYESYQSSNVYNGNITLVRNNGTIYLAYDNPSFVNQNLTLNSATGITFTDTIKFAGNTNGFVEQLSTQPIILPKVVMQKTGGGTVTLNDSVTISTKLNFNGGNIISSSLNQLKFLQNATHAGASASSHVIGAVTKEGDEIFTFPVGGPLSYNPVGIDVPVGTTRRFSAQYKNQNPGSDGYNTSLKAGSFGTATISKAAYWDVKRLEGVTNVTLTLGFGTNPYEQYPASLSNLKVAHWSGSQWDDHGNAAPTGTAANGSINNSVAITSFSPFTLAGATSTYFYAYSNPGAGPDGTPVKFKGIGGYPSYQTKQLPAGAYTADSIYLIPNASTVGFKLKDLYGVEKDDTTVTAPIAPTTYITANGNGSVNFVGWRHFVYVKNVSNEIIGAIKDNDLTLGNTTMRAYFSTASVATAPNGNKFLKRSFIITSQFAPVGTKRVRFYISKTEFNNLLAADPTSFPSGINSLTITKYTGSVEDSLFNPMPTGVASIIPNADITIVDLGTMYFLDIDVTGFSGFYIGGNQSQLNICKGSSISIPSNISGATYQWQADAGAGYTNIANGAVYSGTATKTLTLTNTPASIYGYKFRCVVNGGTFSQIYTLKLNTSWEGNVSNVWENAANWSCGVLPDAGSDVVIDAGKTNYPQVNVNTSVRTITINASATVTVKTGATLTVIK